MPAPTIINTPTRVSPVTLVDGPNNTISIVASGKTIRLAISDFPAGVTDVRLRETEWCEADGTPKRALVMRSDPYTP